MGVGMPGFGIASIFYLLAGLFTPLHELAFVPRAQRSAERWRTAWTQFALALATIAAIGAFYLLIDAAVDHGWITRARGPAILTRAPNYVWATLALAVVLLAGVLYGAWVAVTGGEESADQIAAAHRGHTLAPTEPVVARPAIAPAALRPMRFPSVLDWEHLAWALISLNPPDGGQGRHEAAFAPGRDTWIRHAPLN